MSELICLNCNSSNSSGQSSCENCGEKLLQKAIIVRPDYRVSVTGSQLPTRYLKPIGASIIISAAALLAEFGFLYLRNRFNKNNLSLLPWKRKKDTEEDVQLINLKKPIGKRVISVHQEQVIEELSWGRPVRRIITRMSWHSDERLES